MNVLEGYIDQRKIDEYVLNVGVYPLFNAMTEALKIPFFVDEQCGSFDRRLLLTPGQLAKAFIINILAGRQPVYKISESFEEQDCEVLFGPGIESKDLTEARLGDALDAIATLDQQKLFSQIALRAMNLHGISTNTVHVDTTNFSVFGDYEKEDHDGFNAAYTGDPKSGRKDLKAVGLGAAVQENKIPFLFQALSGNDSDTVWFRNALAEITSLFNGDLYSRPVLVFDAAASNKEMFEMATASKTPCIIRLSRVFNAVDESISRAWQGNRWEKVGKISSAKKGSEYKVCAFDFENVPGWRLVVIHSTTLEKTKRKNMDRSLPKKRKRIEKQAAVLGKKEFETRELAEKAAAAFVQKHITLTTPFTYTVNINTKVTEKYARPGRPTADTPKIKVTSYTVEFVLGDVDEELYDTWLKKESCFVLADNVPSDRFNAKEVLRTYKKQWNIEDVFRFIKTPLDFGPLWLDTPRRIKSLLFLISLSVLVGSFLLFRLHQTLSGKPQGKEDPNAPPRKFTDVTGRRVEKPTFNMVREHLLRLKIVVYYNRNRGCWIRKFLKQTRHSWLQTIVDIGFDPAIYLEPYSDKFDLWCYKI